MVSRFASVGARVKIGPPERRSPEAFSADVRRDRHGEYFDLAIAKDVIPEVIDAQPKQCHLLLLVRNGRTKEKYLCGHDERHWFVAAVPGGSVRNVSTAISALRPSEVNPNTAVRQGEWFFVPCPHLEVDNNLILRHEPISRGRGKPHLCQELFRRGGVSVCVCRYRPAGVSEEEMQRIVDANPKAKSWGWTRMRRDAEVYVRGWVRHADHKTVVLNGWHRVYLNSEQFAPWSKSVVFLD